jgi:hypothetical protein
MKKLLFFIFLCQFFSCGVVVDENIKEEEKPPKEFSTSSLKYFMNLNTMVYDNSISPHWISRLDTALNFSVGFRCEVKKLFEEKISKAVVSVKYYFQKPGKASVVCLINKGDSILFWKAIEVDQPVPINKWTSKEVTFDLLQTYKDDEVLTVYVWSPNRDEVYVDDLCVKPLK